MTKRSLNQAPGIDLLFFYRQDLQTKALRFRDSSYIFDAEPIWSLWMEELIIALTKPEYLNRLEYYPELSLNPHIFGWYVGTANVTRYFEQNGRCLQSHPDWERLWHRALTISFTFLHGRVPISVKLPSRLALNQYDEPIHPGDSLYYRAEAIQLVYNHMIIERALGVFPDRYTQVVEFGGGTGLHSILLRALGFRGTHYIYDMLPMLLLQQYFLRYSGWPAYLGEKLYEADMRNSTERTNSEGLLGYESVSQGRNMKGRNIILGQLPPHLYLISISLTVSLTLSSLCDDRKQCHASPASSQPLRSLEFALLRFVFHHRDPPSCPQLLPFLLYGSRVSIRILLSPAECSLWLGQ
jgi:hypothetical protein